MTVNGSKTTRIYLFIRVEGRGAGRINFESVISISNIFCCHQLKLRDLCLKKKKQQESPGY